MHITAIRFFVSFRSFPLVNCVSLSSAHLSTSPISIPLTWVWFNALKVVVLFANQPYQTYKIWTQWRLFLMGQSRPLFVYFRSFHIPIQMTNIQFEQYKLKKCRWCAWNSNPGQQDGRRRRIYWAMAATHFCPYQHSRLLFSLFSSFQQQITVNYKNGWNWTRVLWCQKRLLCQMGHSPIKPKTFKPVCL